METSHDEKVNIDGAGNLKMLFLGHESRNGPCFVLIHFFFSFVFVSEICSACVSLGQEFAMCF